MEKQYLKKLIKENLSIYKIAKVVNKSYSTVKYWLNKYNLKTNFKSFKETGKKEYGETRFCQKCKKDCKTIDFYNRRGKKYASSYCKICTNIISALEIKIERDLIPKIKTVYTDEIRKKMSNARIKFLKENPDKHPWKTNNKFKSIPCENFKAILEELNIQFIPEFTLSNERLFAIDIALPQYKIAIEINGNQHYNKDGTLKPYYQERHDFLINLEYEVHELHYSLFFDKDKMIKLINLIIDNKILYDFDYDEYLLKKLNKNTYKCECGNEMNKLSNKCKECNSFDRRKVIRPDLDILLEDVKNLGYRGSGRKYGVSDSCIKKWIKSEINKKSEIF